VSIRDTQFKGFANALLKELVDDMLDEYGFMERSHYEDGDLKTAEELLARRAYDLAQHAIGEFVPRSEDSSEEYMKRIPDMAELPDDDKRYAEMQNAEEQE
jgi:hypothetical protein